MSIEVKDVSKVYGEKKALDKVNFAMQSGEVVGFLGPNGAGKSTMMKILTTYISQNEGTVKVKGYNTLTNPFEVKSSIGYLPEHNPLYMDLFVKEYLNFNAKIHRVSQERIAEVIDMVGLVSEQKKKINQLSKGYKQRVGLAAALLHDPEVLILDEPTTGLDPNQLMEIRKVIRKIGETKTVLLSTHIMQEVEAMCDRVIIINKGEIVADERLSDLLENQEQIIEVEFDARLDELLLRKIPNIKGIESAGNNTWLLSFDTMEDRRSSIFDFAHQNGLRTLQLRRKIVSLQTLFQNLTN